MMTGRGEMNSTLKHKSFTLVEVLVASMISFMFVSGAFYSYRQLIEVNRDCTADIILRGASRLLKKKMVRTFKLNQVIWEDTNTNSQRNINFKIVKPEVNFPSSFMSNSDKQQMKIHYIPGAKGVMELVTGGKSEKLHNIYDVSIESFDAEKVESLGADVLSMKKVQISFSLKILHSGKVYHRNDSLVVPVFNFNR